MVTQKIILNNSTTASTSLRGPFTEVFVMGMYHSGTNALIRELQHYFNVPVYPNDNGSFHPNGTWKHTIRPQISSPANRLHCVLVKDPYFWVQSVKKCPYELKVSSKVIPIQTTDLLDTVQLEDRQYPNIMALWNQYTKTYLDDRAFSPQNTVVIRYQDFLYRYREVMTTLSKYLPRRPGSSQIYQPFSQRSKSHGIFCRNRDEAIAYYRPENRYLGFTQNELEKISQSLDTQLMDQFNYLFHPQFNPCPKTNQISKSNQIPKANQIPKPKQLPSPIQPAHNTPEIKKYRAVSEIKPSPIRRDPPPKPVHITEPVPKQPLPPNNNTNPPPLFQSIYSKNHPKSRPMIYLPTVSYRNAQVMENLLSNGRVGIDQLYRDVVMRRRLVYLKQNG